MRGRPGWSQTAAVTLFGAVLLLDAPAAVPARAAQAPEPAANAAAQAGAPPDVRAGARRALARYGPAVVTVRVVIKRRFISQGRERGSVDSQLELAGTTLTPGGLTVVSDATTNPSALTPAGDSETRLDTETTDVKLLLRDGRELPARFVLRDKDLDLAFLVPDEAGLALPYLDLAAEPGPVPEPLDEIVYIFPLSRSLGREPGVAVDRVRGVTRKPRTFLASDLVVGMQTLGCPVFDAAGRPVGLSVMRRAARTPSAGGGFRDVFDAFTPVVLTADDVQTVARQALEQAALKPGDKPPAEQPSPPDPRGAAR
jgi:S1-C subfamily serine protease